MTDTYTELDSTVVEILQHWEARFRVENFWSERVTGSIRFTCSPDNTTSFVIAPGNPPRVILKAEPEFESDCTAMCSAEVLLEMLTGNENPQALWHDQQITVTGDPSHLLVLAELMEGKAADN